MRAKRSAAGTVSGIAWVWDRGRAFPLWVFGGRLGGLVDYGLWKDGLGSFVVGIEA